jgi:hypothetical protein
MHWEAWEFLTIYTWQIVAAVGSIVKVRKQVEVAP